MIFEQLNPHYCRTYLVASEDAGQAILIDPVLDHVRDYLTLLEGRQLALAAVVDTHTHADHISGSAGLKDVTGCTYVMHGAAPARCPDMHLEDGLEWGLFDEFTVRALHTPGHTKDSVCLVFPDRVFTGDTLFLDDGGAGRDDLPGGDPGAHWESLQKLIALPDGLIVFPAHEYRGRQPSSLAQQRKTNPHLKPRTKDEFVHYLEDLKLGQADWMKDVLKANYACALDPKAAWIPVDLPACEVKGTLRAGVNETDVQSISAEALRKELRDGPPPLLLDVREERELSGKLGHLDGIVHIPIGELAGRLAELEGRKADAIVAVCRSGSRARTAAQILTVAGFTNVRVLEGGMKAWRAQ